MIRNFRIDIEYDGTSFHGWQRQRSDRTVQGEIESALWQMIGTAVNVTGSGRTDAGVHAMGQVANFKCDTHLTADIFKNGLNSLLSSDVVIYDCREVALPFHARFDAISKTYIYRILNAPSPQAIGRQYAWYIRRKLNLDEMQQAANLLIGEHDFKSFEGTGSPRSSTVRNIARAEFIERDFHFIQFEIKADGFLRYMVRNIVGTLVDVGVEKLTAVEFGRILRSLDRGRAGATAPPQGLFLKKVDYKSP